MGQSPRAWFVELLDGFLSESLRRSSPLELGRARLLAGVCWGLILCVTLVLLQGLVNPIPLTITVVGSACALGFAVVLLLLRRATSTRPLALLLCSLVTGGMITHSLYMRDLAVAAHASLMLVPVVSVYLLGWRLGLVFSVAAAVNVGLVFPLHTWGSLEGRGPMLCSFAAIYVLCAWAVGWLFISARDEAQAMVEQMLRTLRESEGQLVSLIESTDDVVISLDSEGRVVTANDAARQLFLRVVGRELRKGAFAFGEFPPEERARWLGFMVRALGGERVKQELILPTREWTLTVELTVSPVRGEGERVVGTTLFGRDITARKAAEARLSEMHRNLLDVSRQAGMAEIATGVLHNVGNALNSVNVSAGLVTERLHRLHVSGMSQAMELLDAHAGDLGHFLTQDARGQQVPVYLKALARRLTQERDEVLAEVRTLCQCVDHIKAVVCMQQQHARASGVVELLPVPELLDDALRLHALSFERVGIQVRREYAPVQPVWVDRHKLLQILLNLVSNARHALLESERADKQLTLRVGWAAGGKLRIEVVDNGVGVAPENLPRLFTQGFTTKRDGHGFGLHISALAAGEMRGALSCTSAGRGQGATFTLVLPTEPSAEEGTGHASPEREAVALV
ncbi:ATP-binding protein [Vitiosangium sp. GDMCC 1.1324]|uniref:ATP-binding protein n=1 Tax=Vitiosangium sp. (strain GDMCC 1.1324) TaxID=2138576 RepID=UPI000D3823DF|nr:ATP-binding protein [Vitiosangium sp. GDMCC 1.1324]PTL85287.1 nitrogen regulation protein NtrB [Vitiosangium sp. GDMCC 1.1324]